MLNAGEQARTESPEPTAAGSVLMMRPARGAAATCHVPFARGPRGTPACALILPAMDVEACTCETLVWLLVTHAPSRQKSRLCTPVCATLVTS